MPNAASSPLPPRELLELAHQNFAESMREHARFTVHGIIDERAETLRTVNATRFPAGMFNVALGTGAPPADPERWLVEQREYFATHQRGFSIYVRGDRDHRLHAACIAAGLPLGEAPPGMVCEAPPAAAPDDARLRIELVQTLDSAQEMITVQARAYATLGLPEKVTRTIFGDPERLLAPHRLWFLARSEGAPVAAAMVLFSHSIAGIYWVATLPEKRGQGLGEQCTRAATRAAFERGARAVVLQASQQGEPVYRRIGYREFVRYPWFLARYPQPE